MPQEFLALCCYNCHMFQVQQRTKTKKWACKTCGSKQSIIKVYASSSKAAEVRPVVQNLNLKKGQLQEERSKKCYDQEQEREEELVSREEQEEQVREKWGRYLDDDDQEQNDHDDDDDDQITTVLPDEKRKRRRSEKRSVERISLTEYNDDHEDQPNPKKRRFAKIEEDDDNEELQSEQVFEASVSTRVSQPKKTSLITSGSRPNHQKTTAKKIEKKAPVAASAGKWAKYMDDDDQQQASDDDNEGIAFTSDDF